MKRILIGVVAMLAAMAVASAPTAGAKPCGSQNNVPPGNSEVDQYSETVPGDCGNQPSPTPSADDDPAGSIPAGTLSQLEKLGADGRAAALLTAAADREDGLAGVGGGGGGGGGAGAGGGESTDLPAGQISSPADESDEGGLLDALGDALSGDGGLGWIVPVLLLVIVALAIATYLRQRRTA